MEKGAHRDELQRDRSRRRDRDRSGSPDRDVLQPDARPVRALAPRPSLLPGGLAGGQPGERIGDVRDRGGAQRAHLGAPRPAGALHRPARRPELAATGGRLVEVLAAAYPVQLGWADAAPPVVADGPGEP